MTDGVTVNRTRHVAYLLDSLRDPLLEVASEVSLKGARHRRNHPTSKRNQPPRELRAFSFAKRKVVAFLQETGPFERVKALDLEVS